MSQSVTERLEFLRAELDLMEYRDPKAYQRAASLRRQIAMLTEDQRQKPPLPKQARRFK